MKVKVLFHSYFRELTGQSEAEFELANGSNLGALEEDVFVKFPKLRVMRRSSLVAVGVEYQSADYLLREGDEVSFFPPVQGG